MEKADEDHTLTMTKVTEKNGITPIFMKKITVMSGLRAIFREHSRNLAIDIWVKRVILSNFAQRIYTSKRIRREILKLSTT